MASLEDITKNVTCAQEPLWHVKYEIRQLEKKQKENAIQKITELWKERKDIFKTAYQQIDALTSKADAPRKKTAAKEAHTESNSADTMPQQTAQPQEIEVKNLPQPEEKQRTTQEPSPEKEDIPLPVAYEENTPLATLKKALHDLIENFDTFIARNTPKKEQTPPAAQHRKLQP